ncbi:sensor histidine kinase [Pseudofulvibacter geojedonensis]|uniref:Sensor histidine kinase n=1 Tax=Pseudofulvibacter geojedonensis TaxID=1123758 RepID=A0ABW3HY79_9FLAO
MQAQEPVFLHLTEKNGLPDKEFYSIVEDSKGFIWLAADKGLFKYDGKKFKQYTNQHQKGLSVFGVKQDEFNQIWCNNISGQFFYTKNNKLNLFIDLSSKLKGELADFAIGNHYLWVFSLSKVYQISLKSKEISTFLIGDKDLGNPFSDKKAIYFQSKDSVYRIDLGKSAKLHSLATHLPYRTKNNSAISQGKSIIFKQDSESFLVQSRMSKNIFFRFNISKNRFKKIKGLEAVADKRIYAIFSNNNEIWIGTNKGVWMYSYTNDKFQFKKQLFKEEDITRIVKDKDDNYWFTTLNSGIYIIPNINIEKSSILSENKNISSLDKVNDSTLIFGLTNGKIGVYDTKKNSSKIITLPTNDRVSSLIYHPSNKIIVSKDRSSYVVNIKNSKYTKVSDYQAVKSFLIDDNGNLVSTNYYSVKLVRESDIELDKNTLLTKRKIISTGKRTYTSLYDKQNKEVYVAYVDDLIVYDSVWNSKEIQYKNKPIYGKSITKTNDGTIWVATFKNGVLGIKNNTVLYHYNVHNGLTSNNIEKIKADKDILWIALENSIQSLNINTKQFKTLTKNEGVLSYDISGIEIVNDRIYFSSSEGLFSIDKEKSFKNYHPQVYFNQIQINEKDTSITSSYNLKFHQNSIKLGFNVNGLSYNTKGRYKYRLKGFNDKWFLTDAGENAVKYNSLPAGNFTFQVQPSLPSTSKASTIKEINIVINLPFWKTWWFITLIILFITIGIVLYFKSKMRKKERERVVELEKLSLEKEIIAINLTALRSQMNPHFIFNALNSIQDLVLKQDTEASYDSIVLFAELIRNALNYSNKDFIPIEKELRFLKVYLQLEKLRFGKEFTYDINYSENIEINVPSLLIQPFIENSLVHGLLHKSGNKILTINFKLMNEVLQCTIIDNGIGRVEAAKISKRQGNHHESYALGAIEKRLEIFKKQFNGNIGYSIEDLYEKNLSIGTKVVVLMPFKRQF